MELLTIKSVYEKKGEKSEKVFEIQNKILKVEEKI